MFFQQQQFHHVAGEKVDSVCILDGVEGETEEERWREIIEKEGRVYASVKSSY
jgi:hypothetical protein